MKNRICFICALIAVVLLFMSCNNYNATGDVGGTAADFTSGDESTKAEESGDETAGEAPGGADAVFEFKYLTEDSDKNKVNIKRPVFSDGVLDKLISDRLDDYLNEVLFGEFSLELSDEPAEIDGEAYSEYYVELSCNEGYFRDDVVSFVFEGFINYYSSAHPTNLAFSINISMAEKGYFYPSENYDVEQLYGLFASNAEAELTEFMGGAWIDGLAPFTESICTYDAFVEGIKNESRIYTFYNADGMGIIYPVPHALGDVRTIIIPYEMKK